MTPKERTAFQKRKAQADMMEKFVVKGAIGGACVWVVIILYVIFR